MAAPSPLCVSLCALNTEVLWTSCLSVGTWALSLPLQGLLVVWEQPLSNLGVLGSQRWVAGRRTLTPLLLRHERKPAGALLTDLSLSPHTSRNTEKKVVKITSEISQMEVRFLLLLRPLHCEVSASPFASFGGSSVRCWGCVSVSIVTLLFLA